MEDIASSAKLSTSPAMKDSAVANSNRGYGLFIDPGEPPDTCIMIPKYAGIPLPGYPDAILL
jgi:hypothetical protein